MTMTVSETFTIGGDLRNFCEGNLPSGVAPISALPRIDYNHSGIIEIVNITGDHSQTVNERGSGDQSIGVIAPLWNMQVGTTRRYRVIDWQNSLGKRGANMAVHPLPQTRTLRTVPTLDG